MKQKLRRSLIVSALTLIILAPALSVFELVWLQNHADVVQQWQIFRPLETIAWTVIGLFLLTTLTFCAWIPVYEAYCAYRTAMFKRRIAALERLWQLSTYR